MATKSFTTEFRLNAKGAENLINALSDSKKVEIKIDQDVETAHTKNQISSLISRLNSKG